MMPVIASNTKSILRPCPTPRHARRRVDGQIKRTIDSWAILNGERDGLRANLSVKIPLSGQLSKTIIRQGRLVGCELLDSGIEVPAKVILDVINDKRSGELVAASDTLDESGCGRHLCDVNELLVWNESRFQFVKGDSRWKVLMHSALV